MARVCAPCQEGQHSHDRHTGVRGAPGTDGGCPRAVEGWPCECPVVLPPLPVSARHCSTCRCGA